jgi:hypothetical protein
MKRISAMSVIIAFLLLVVAGFVFAQEMTPRWKYYSSDGAHNDHYYDTKSIVHVSKGIVKVWEKKVAIDKSDEVMKKMKELSELKEVNCRTREYRIFVRYYDTTSQPLKSHVEPTQWESIEPDSWMEALFDIACKTKKKK